MDSNDLLGLSATFDRVAVAVERDGIDAHALERVMAWGVVTFGRQLTRRHGGTEEPFVTVAVRNWKSLTRTNRDQTTAELLTYVLRELSYSSKRERHGFGPEHLDPALSIAEDPSRYSERVVRSALTTLEACVRYSRDDDEKDTARALVRKLTHYLGDQT